MSSSKSESVTASVTTSGTSFSNESEQRQNGVAATAAGAGSGTLVALIANNLSDNNWLKPWLVLIAPSISIASGAIWVWLQAKFVNYVKEYEFKLFVAQAIKTIDEALKDPNLTEEKLLELRKMRNELTQAKIERIMAKFKSIQITSK
jgi:hypothetical protein